MSAPASSAASSVSGVDNQQILTVSDIFLAFPARTGLKPSQSKWPAMVPVLHRDGGFVLQGRLAAQPIGLDGRRPQLQALGRGGGGVNAGGGNTGGSFQLL